MRLKILTTEVGEETDGSISQFLKTMEGGLPWWRSG